MANGGFTKTEQAILDVLADGQAHARKDLCACLPDEMSDVSNLCRHITAIRKVLRPKGEDILCEFANRRKLYRHIRLLSVEP